MGLQDVKFGYRVHTYVWPSCGLPCLLQSLWVVCRSCILLNQTSGVLGACVCACLRYVVLIFNLVFHAVIIWLLLLFLQHFALLFQETLHQIMSLSWKFGNSREFSLQQTSDSCGAYWFEVHRSMLLDDSVYSATSCCEFWSKIALFLVADLKTLVVRWMCIGSFQAVLFLRHWFLHGFVGMFHHKIHFSITYEGWFG